MIRTVSEFSGIFDRVIAATRLPRREIAGALSKIGFHDVIDCVMDEVSARARLQVLPAHPVPCRLRMGAETGAIERDVILGGGTIWHEVRLDGPPDAVIDQELWEMVLGLFGPQQGIEDSTRTVWIMNEPGPETDDPADPWLLRLRQATVAANALVRCFDRPERDLDRLACHFGSDKWGDHFYTGAYEMHFAPYRNQEVRLLEIGVGGFSDPCAGGESLQVWRHFFPRGKIVGLDVFEKTALNDMRITTVKANQSDHAALVLLSAEFGPFDIIIDDGSHVSEHIIASFETLFPLLADGGLYVIEDLQTAYWSGWNGGSDALDSPCTATGFLKQMLDALHHIDLAGQEIPAQVRQIGQALHAVHFYRNLAVCEKKSNTGQAAPSWVRRTESDMDLNPPGSMRRISPNLP
jgi:MycE methyltransferase N-terminal